MNVETRDISLAGRVLANFPDALTADQQVEDALSELGVSVTKTMCACDGLIQWGGTTPQSLLLIIFFSHLSPLSFSLSDRSHTVSVCVGGGGVCVMEGVFYMY